MSIPASSRSRRVSRQPSGKAIASLVCGLLSFCLPCLPVLPALLLGILGLVDINRSDGRLTGKGMAVTGIVTGLAGNLLLALVAVIAFVVAGSKLPNPFDAPLRMRSQNNLKEIGIAMHNYHDTWGRFPTAAIYDKSGRPVLSWRVALLPLLNEEALYREFHLDEPWDSPHNKALLPRMPKVYACPKSTAVKEPYLTYYQVFVGKPMVRPNPVFVEGQVATIASITDGMSNTFLVVEAGEPVPWTKPADLAYSSSGPLPKLTGPYRGGFFVTLADGSVRWVRADAP